MARAKRDEFERQWGSVEKSITGENANRLDIEHHLDVNLVHATLQTAIPKVILQNPKLVGRAKREGAEQPAKLMERIDNYMIGELRMVPEWRQCVADAHVYGLGILKIGYIPPKKEYKVKKTEDAGDQIDDLERDLQEGLEEKPEEGEGSFAEEDPSALIDPWKKRNQFFIERVSPRMFLWDPEATDIRKMRWVAHEYIMPVSAIKKERRFNERARNRVKGDKRFREGERKFGSTVVSAIDTSVDAPGKLNVGSEDDQAYATLIERWDWENQKLVTVSESCPDVLQEVDWPYPIEGFPFAILRYNITPDEFIPMSDIAAALPQAEELKFLRQKRALHLRRFNRKYAVDPTLYDDDESMETLTAGIDGGIVKAHPNTVAPIQDAATSPDYDKHENAIRQDYREITAQSELERGSGLRGEGTATEAALIDAASRLRSNYMRSLTEEFINDSFRILNALMRTYLDGSIAVKIQGEDTAELVWQEIKREDILGEYDVEVVAGSTLPITQESRKRQLLELLNILLPLIQGGAIPALPILQEIGEAYDIKDFDRFLGIPEGGTSQDSVAAIQQMISGPGASGFGQESQGAPQQNILAEAFGSQRGLGGRNV